MIKQLKHRVATDEQLTHINVYRIEEIVRSSHCRSQGKIDGYGGIVKGGRAFVVEGEASSELVAEVTNDQHIWRRLAHLVGNFTGNKSTV